MQLADDDLRRAASTVSRELRETRIALGLSQRTVAGAAGLSQSRLSRLERGETARFPIDAVARTARVLGLSVTVRLYAQGSPIRDAGQQRLLDRFAALAAPPLRVSREVGLPIAGDLRAWDAAVIAPDAMAFVDAESRLGDVQALERRASLKLRDDPRSIVLILVVARTRHNVAVLGREREALRSLLPLDGGAIAKALRAGRTPHASGLILL
jgi:transcriptional regulator with XRE-family HTH domain